ncbi:hypothetical protein SAMN05216267_1020138 [Actinacidiphila rubida]|uniref:Uncharacterized protein n=1 Tax=Actinacidiphila rubida TaxID=310780 RepID=A0A1H8N0J1_9ACTN|nr:hypothetical protein SAMN05216267_1020138 [Actinacidiphila rubida]
MPPGLVGRPPANGVPPGLAGSASGVRPGLVGRPPAGGCSRPTGCPRGLSAVCRAVVACRAVPRAPDVRALCPWGRGRSGSVSSEMCIRLPPSTHPGAAHISLRGALPPHPLPLIHRAAGDIDTANALPQTGTGRKGTIRVCPRRTVHPPAQPSGRTVHAQFEETLPEWPLTPPTNVHRQGRGELRDQPRRDPRTAARSAGHPVGREHHRPVGGRQAPGAPRWHPVRGGRGKKTCHVGGAARVKKGGRDENR